jgi:TIR domain
VIEKSTPGKPLDFFVSYASTDQDWATWIAQQLIDAGYAVELDVWNWAAGMDVIAVTQQAMDRAARVLEVWSPAFFGRPWAQMEHRASFAASQAEPGLVVPVVVRPCQDDQIPRLYRTLIRVDLFDLPAEEARTRLLAAVAGPKPPTAPLPFPGRTDGHSYPGRLPPIWRVPNYDPFFVGRESVLEQMHARLSEPGNAVALVGEQGAGGTGKSKLAVEYTWRHADEFGLVW